MGNDRKVKKYRDGLLEELYKKVDVNSLLDKYHANIVGNPVLTHRGHEIRMHCLIPGHRDNSPSASFNVDTGMYNCWAKCGGRTFFQLIQEMENLSGFHESVEFVKNLVGYCEEDDDYDDIKRQRDAYKKINDVKDEPVEKEKYVKIDIDSIAEFESALNHMDIVGSRVNEDSVKRWNLKYAVSGFYQGRLIIPFYVDGNVVSFAARDMIGRAEKWQKISKNAREKKLSDHQYKELEEKFGCKKIIYPPTASTFSGAIIGSPIQYILFNLDKVLEIDDDQDYVILTEGPFDAIHLFNMGYKAVAILGTSLSSYKRALIKKNFSTVYVCLDNDNKSDGSNPGQESAQKIMKMLYGDLDVKNIILPLGKDPDDCTNEEFVACAKSAQTYIEE